AFVSSGKCPSEGPKIAAGAVVRAVFNVALSPPREESFPLVGARWLLERKKPLRAAYGASLPRTAPHAYRAVAARCPSPGRPCDHVRHAGHGPRQPHGQPLDCHGPLAACASRELPLPSRRARRRRARRFDTRRG